jgi:polygalacturonase
LKLHPKLRHVNCQYASAIRSFLFALLLFCPLTGLHALQLDILQLGAKPDGVSLNTGIIQNAIDRVSESGGGTVIIPAGRFLTGSFILKSNVSLNINKGAFLLGSRNINDYAAIQPRYVALRTGQPTRQLIFAEGQENIAIRGEGTIDGQGDAFKFTRDGEEGVERPHLIQLINCRQVRIEGVTLRNSGAWMQHYLACENLHIRGINVYNHCNYNNDGIDIDGCRDVVVSDCIIDSDDDGICLKSTSPAVCQDVVVSNCVVKSHCNALKLGTESTGGFRNIAFTNCVVSPSADPDPFYGTLRGQSAISVEMVDGGVLNGVTISNITITETDCPIFIRLGNRARKYASEAPEPGIGILQNVILTDIHATTSSKTTSSITGIPGGYAENIILANISIVNLSGGTKEDASLLVKENDKGYPTPTTFGDILPASAFFVRHVRNISFHNVQVHLRGINHRPVFVFQDVKNARVLNPLVSADALMPGLLVKDAACENVRIEK